MMSDEVLIECVREYIILYDPQNRYYHDNIRKENAWSEISKKTGQSVSDCKKRWTALRDNFRKSIKIRKTTSGQANIPRKKWKYEDIMSFMIPFYSERGQKSNLGEREADERLNNSDDEVDAHCTNANANDNLSESPQHSSDNNTILSQATPYSKKSSIQMSESPQHSSDNNTILSQATPYSKKSSKFDRQQQSIPMAKVLKNYFDEKKASKVSKKGDHIQKFFDAMQETVRTFTPRLQIEIKSKISSLVSEYELKDLMSKQNPSTPQNNHSLLSQVESNAAPNSSTGSESAISGSPLLSPGSESYPIQWQVQMNVPSYSSESLDSPSPLLSLVPASENNYSVQRQDQRNIESLSSSMQTPALCPSLLSPRNENYGNSSYPSRFTQEIEKNTSDMDRSY